MAIAQSRSAIGRAGPIGEGRVGRQEAIRAAILLQRVFSSRLETVVFSEAHCHVQTTKGGVRQRLEEALPDAVSAVVAPRKRARVLLALVFASESGGVGKMTVPGQVLLQRPTQRLAPPISVVNGERKHKELFTNEINGLSILLIISSSMTPGRINSFALVTGNFQSAWQG